jgi:subfamily B ATP-binding cassette protein HlyB/CyaB
MTAEQNPSSTDPGLTVLVALLRFQGIGADPEQVRHRMGMATIGVPEMLRYAKELGLKAKVRSSTWERLATTPQPSIAVLRDGGYLLLGKAATTRLSSRRRTSRGPSS